MEFYPHNLVDQYLKTSNKLKKFDRIVFKRFAPSVSEVHDEFARLAAKFEEADIYPYEAMCHLGVAKCEMYSGSVVNECHAYLRAARAFLRANGALETLDLRSNRGENKEGALRCYTLALERVSDDSVLKAAIIREMTPLQMHYGSTSSFSSPAHRIYELELGAHAALERGDFLLALQQLDDIVDNVSERKQHSLYEGLLRRVEVLRVLLLIALDLSPVHQSPAHIKLIEFYYAVGNLDEEKQDESILHRNHASGTAPGTYLSTLMKNDLGEIVLAWRELRRSDLKTLLETFNLDYVSLNDAQRFVIESICTKLDKSDAMC